MPPSREEAAQALREISNVQARVAGFQDYRFEASQLIVWGLLNIIGCIGSALFADHLLLIWFAVVVVGLVLGVAMAIRGAPTVPGVVWRYLLVILSILLFDILLHCIFWPLSPRQGSMIVPLFVATIYIVRGAQSRPRYIAIGANLALLCTLSFLFAGDGYWYWLAVAWGGTFVISGLWLRRC
ncbi:hypothetical protein GCM10007421_17410 [Halopseudomonas oceani]|uniref:Uncharacterized protein n=1 Tax=Halopseudomonas oceani TaxID=1708783 RepID=A0A2P4EUW6_9GAMM|nr:hypothetical protein [Halopseudomonas oceani]POB03364.1 hypothetical protein C1949_09800 [Halopseudomonas oceani]GGE43694.1 hypothetical protein GCM10007421_17410 [Halopseudomonas oceani]